MIGNAAHKLNHNQIPYISWKGEQELLFTYLTSDSVERISVPVEAGDVIEVPGQLHDRDITYRIRRNPKPPAAEQQKIEKILVLGDMHGMYGKFFDYLHQNQVIDEEGHWIWGNGHLVMSGDVLDRGDAVMETLWLLYQLELEAADAGGALHYLLGNHELMVMEGDLRYVNRKSLQLFRERNIPYQDQFSSQSIFGQWLRSRNSTIRLNELLISHAGISPVVAREGLRLSDINRNIQEYLQHDQIDHQTELLTGQQGPLWYRGYIMSGFGYGTINQDQVEEVLQQYQASHMVVAHTTVDTVQSRYNGKLFAVDLDVNNPRIRLEGLLYEQGKFFRVRNDATADEL